MRPKQGRNPARKAWRDKRFELLFDIALQRSKSTGGQRPHLLFDVAIDLQYFARMPFHTIEMLTKTPTILIEQCLKCCARAWQLRAFRQKAFFERFLCQAIRQRWCVAQPLAQQCEFSLLGKGASCELPLFRQGNSRKAQDRQSQMSFGLPNAAFFGDGNAIRLIL